MSVCKTSVCGVLYLALYDRQIKTVHDIAKKMKRYGKGFMCVSVGRFKLVQCPMRREERLPIRKRAQEILLFRSCVLRYTSVALKPFALRGACFLALVIASALDVALIRMKPYCAPKFVPVVLYV